ncbi:MAG TPA: trehalose-6-phosphate synthase [Terriglobia bacterium]|nr:trehalose-6-phosphate synthase [Terriglobia bacterium]
MRFSFRLILSLAFGITVVTFLFARAQVRAEKRDLRNDLEKRAEVLAESMEETAEPLLARGLRWELQRVVDRFGNRERLAGIAVYDRAGRLMITTPRLDALVGAASGLVSQALAQGSGRGDFVKSGGNDLHIYVMPLRADSGAVVGALALFHDADYIEAASAGIWKEALAHVLIQMVLIVLVTLLIVRWSVRGPIAKMAQWMKAQRAGGAAPQPDIPEDLFKPLAHEVTNLASSLQAARDSAETEARLRDLGEAMWTPERLHVHVQGLLQGNGLYVVSNREPYIHRRRGNATEVMVPASGLVTAMEPILVACAGTWIANGSGDADRENVDAHDRLRVPPDQPQYALRRVWLSREEEAGYYLGFSNEGLWPLCHIAHTRPLFRAEDWQRYREVNEKFARAVVEEMAGAEEPLLLIQDYHFALLPRLVKKARPDARVSIFWHIPWPNPQVFGICPWQSEVLNGLLGADLVGFHIQAHCNHFLETVDAALESHVDWEHFAVDRRGHRTLVRPFPISVAAENREQPAARSVYVERAKLFKRLDVEGAYLGVGVDRLDYTKGIVERFRGIERFLELHPRYQGQFTFVQIAAPSRSEIPRYARFVQEVTEESERINGRFQKGKWKPIVLLRRHHSHAEIAEYYRAADLCLVTSLHDGMNLVAKEFVASRDDEQGALILSQFTGAAHELPDALVVNPYDTEQVAQAIRLALEMDPEDGRARMRRMRVRVQEHNVYHWAASLIGALAEIRVDHPIKPQAEVLPIRTLRAAAGQTSLRT